MAIKTKVYINGRLVGFHASGEKLAKELIDKRRAAKLDRLINIAWHEDTNEVYINTDSGRVQRPLLVAEDGKLKLTEEHLKLVREGKLSWKELVEKGIIEYLDAEEEENTLIALNENELAKEHTHMEINPISILGIMCGMIPYLEHNLAGKVLHGAKMFKQALGIGAINHFLRTDTESYLLYYPQKCLVKTRVMDLAKMNERPHIQNLVVALMPYRGFNILDAVVINKGAVDRALGRASYFRTYEAYENHYPGGQIDKFEIPAAETVGYLGEEFYKKLGEDGLAEIESHIKSGEVIAGRTSPPRFLEEISEFGVIKEKRKESSLSIRKGKEGIVDTVMITEGDGRNRLAKIRIRSEMIPELGDKFSSKHGQKGVVGMIIPEEDMPFTAEGVKPDLILNPHAIPTRMTIGHLIEMLAGKAASLKAEEIDGTPFNEVSEEELKKMLLESGFRNDGKETLYDGVTGERIEGEVFVGVVSYRRLFHMVAHKMQARSRGPVQMLTRQPTEGKEREGGLRFGEMEGETLVGHGAAMLLQEKLVEDSDKVIELVCERCGTVAINDQIRNRKYCSLCKGSRVYPVEMTYGFKLLLEELKALGIMPKLVIEDKV